MPSHRSRISFLCPLFSPNIDTYNFCVYFAVLKFILYYDYSTLSPSHRYMLRFFVLSVALPYIFIFLCLGHLPCCATDITSHRSHSVDVLHSTMAGGGPRDVNHKTSCEMFHFCVTYLVKRSSDWRASLPRSSKFQRRLFAWNGHLMQ